MNKRLRQLIGGLLLIAMIVFAAPLQMVEALAADGKITFSDPSAMVGNQVTVNVTVSATNGALGGADIMLAYDPAVLEFVSGTNANGGAGSIRLIGTMDSDNTTAFNYSLTFKTLQAGNTGISVASYEIYDKDTQPVNISHVGSSAVKVTPLATYSSEAALSSLEISPGELSPAFSAGETNYTTTVGGDVEKLVVSAKPKDSKAKVVINGSSDLKVGENTVVCKVTAEDGQTVKSYTINVTKLEAPITEEGADPMAPVVGDLKTTVGEQEYAVATAFDETTLPEGFEAATAVFNGNEIMAGKGIEKPLTLIYLVAADGSGDFFILDETAGVCKPFVNLHVSEKSVVILEPDGSVEIPAGFAESSIELDGRQVTGWVWSADTEQRYCVFYGMNWNGETGLYRYDIGEKTIQRYFEDPQAAGTYTQEQYVEVAEQYNSLLEDYNLRFMVIVGLIILCLILLFIIVHLSLRRRERYDDEDYEEEPEKEVYRGQEHRDAERYMRDEAPEEDDFQEYEDTAPVESELRSQLAKEAAAAKEADDFEFIDLD